MSSSRLSSTWTRIDSTQPGFGPSENPTQNPIWIIQKCIQSICNPYPIKWTGLKIQKYEFGFEINPFKWIKSNMDLGSDS